jgi:hypothetical protein
MSALRARPRCGAVVAHERIGGWFGDPMEPVRCLLPRDHDGPHADWTAWFGVDEPDFSAPGATRARETGARPAPVHQEQP